MGHQVNYKKLSFRRYWRSGLWQRGDMKMESASWNKKRESIQMMPAGGRKGRKKEKIKKNKDVAHQPSGF